MIASREWIRINLGMLSIKARSGTSNWLPLLTVIHQKPSRGIVSLLLRRMMILGGLGNTAPNDVQSMTFRPSCMQLDENISSSNVSSIEYHWHVYPSVAVFQPSATISVHIVHWLKICRL